jgi:hypothetical protein
MQKNVRLNERPWGALATPPVDCEGQIRQWPGLYLTGLDSLSKAVDRELKHMNGWFVDYIVPIIKVERVIRCRPIAKADQ